MRKFMAALAIVIMVFGLGGCQGKQQPGAPIVPPKAQTPESVAQGEVNIKPAAPAGAPAAPTTEAPK